MRVRVTGASGFVGSYVTTFCPAHYRCTLEQEIYTEWHVRPYYSYG